jgi:hypothetical protein
VNCKGELSLLDEFLPSYHFSERHELEINAPAATVYASVMACDLTQSPVVKWLFQLRRLPWGDVTLDGLERIGFQTLRMNRDREVVMGLVGRFWTVSGGILAIHPDEFVRFDAPGYAKAAFNFQLQPRGHGRTALTTETRIWCTSPRSKMLFGFYWAGIRPFSGLVRHEWLRVVKRQAEM